MTSPQFNLPAPEPGKQTNKEQVDSLRGRMRDAAKGNSDLERLTGDLIAILEDAKNTTRKIRVQGFECAKCGHRCPHVHFVETTDPKTAMTVLDWFIAQTEGRPGVAGAEDSGITVRYEIVPPSE